MMCENRNGTIECLENKFHATPCPWMNACVLLSPVVVGDFRNIVIILYVLPHYDNPVDYII